MSRARRNASAGPSIPPQTSASGSAASRMSASGTPPPSARTISVPVSAGIGRISIAASCRQPDSSGALFSVSGTRYADAGKPSPCSCRKRHRCRRSPPMTANDRFKCIPSFLISYAARRKKAPAFAAGASVWTRLFLSIISMSGQPMNHWVQ